MKIVEFLDKIGPKGSTRFMPITVNKSKRCFTILPQGILCANGECICHDDPEMKRLDKHKGATGQYTLWNDDKLSFIARMRQMQNWDTLGFDTRFEHAWAVIDVDYFDKDKKLSTDMSFITDKHPYHLSYTKKLPKIWVKLDKKPPTNRFDTKWPGVELLYGQWSYARKEDEVFNSDKPILEMSLNDILPQPLTKKPTHIQGQMCLPSTSTPIHLNEKKSIEYDTNLHGDIRIVDLIPNKCWDDYENWMMLLGIMYNTGYTLKDAHLMSQKSPKYDADSVDKKWNSFTSSPITRSGFGTLMHLAKEGDSQAYSEIVGTTRTLLQGKCMLNLLSNPISESTSAETTPPTSVIPPDTPDTPNFDKIEEALFNCTKELTNAIAGEIFEAYHGKKYSFSKGIWYRLNNGGIYEELDDTDNSVILARKVKESLCKWISVQIIKHTHNSDKIKILNSSLTRSQQNMFMKNTVDMLRMLFLDENLYKKLDKNLSLVGFTNGVFDLELGEFRTAKRDDYVSLTTGYDYTKLTDDENKDNRQYFDGLIESIFENKEREKWFKVHLGSLLVGGNPEETVYFWVGAGRNGKGTIDKLLRYAFGRYYGDVAPAYFTEREKDPSRPQADVLAFRNVRVGMCQEPGGTDKQQWQTNKLKRVTGGDALTARGVYEKKQVTFVPHHKQLCCTNHLPTFTEIDGGLISRLRVVRFPLEFLDSNKYDPSNPAHRRVNTSLKKETEKYQHLFLNYLFEHYQEYAKSGLPHLPKCMMDELREYQQDVDTVKIFLDNNTLKIDNDDKFIQITELHNQFKQVEYMSIKSFNNRLKSLKLPIARKSCYEGKVNCLIGYQWV